jgi:predicted MFS family arabinose efflux permease
MTQQLSAADTTAAPSVPKPSTIKGWLAVASLALGAFAVVAGEFLPLGILPLVARDLHVSTGTAGFMVLAPSIAAAIAAPTIVVGSARLGRRQLILALSVLLVASNVLAAFAPNFGVLIVARVLVGIALGGFWSVGPSLGFRLVREGSGTRATAIILAGVSVGTVVALPIGQAVGEAFGWRVVFGGAAVLAIVILIAQLFLLPRMSSSPGLSFGALLRVFRSPAARVGLITTVLVFAGQFAASTFMTPFLTHETSVGEELTTILFLAYGISGLVGTLVGGILVSRSRIGTMVGILLGIGVVLALIPTLNQSVVGVSILFVLWGFLFGIVPLSLQTWMMASLPDAPEAASAILVTVLQVAIATGSLVGAMLVDSTGLRSDFFVAGGLALLGAIFMIIVRKLAPR